MSAHLSATLSDVVPADLERPKTKKTVHAVLSCLGDCLPDPTDTGAASVVAPTLVTPASMPPLKDAQVGLLADKHEALAVFLRYVWSAQPLSHLKSNFEKLLGGAKGSRCLGQTPPEAHDGELRHELDEYDWLLRPAALLLAAL